MVLEKRGLEKIIDEFPDLRRQIEEVAVSRQGENRVKYAKLKKAGVMRDDSRGRAKKRLAMTHRAGNVLAPFRRISTLSSGLNERLRRSTNANAIPE